MLKGYLLSKAAQDDLREIRAYTRSTWGENQAKTYLSTIKNGLDSLVTNPESGKVRDEIHVGLRSIVTGKHIIFYRIGKTHIEVARILHGRMDVNNRFGQV